MCMLLLAFSNAFAATQYNCNGGGMNVSGDANGNIWINGQYHIVSGKTVDGQGVVTGRCHFKCVNSHNQVS